MTKLQTAEMLLGALVADAACLGTHWIYEPDRIAAIAARQDGQVAFTPVDAANYDGVKGYFAHGARQNGMFTQIGESLWLAIQTMNATGGVFDVAAYQHAFVAHFGAGGAYHGYIDGPTRAALANIAAEASPSGSDDDQTPALTRLPAILAGHAGDANLSQVIADAVQVTNVNPIAAAYSAAFADLLGRVMAGDVLASALVATAEAADDSIKADIIAALSHEDPNSTDFAGMTGMMGRACSLPLAGPLMFHILRHADSYVDAIDRNIRAGGDSAGRSIMIGAIMARVHGVAVPKGVPLGWAMQLKDATDIWQGCTALARV